MSKGKFHCFLPPEEDTERNVFILRQGISRKLIKDIQDVQEHFGTEAAGSYAYAVIKAMLLKPPLPEIVTYSIAEEPYREFYGEPIYELRVETTHEYRL